MLFQSSIIGLLALASSASARVGEHENDRKLAKPGGNGNGFPSGPHFNLNLIAYPKGGSKEDVVTRNVNGNGHRIFVPSSGKATIDLLNADVDTLCTQGGFQVIDYFAGGQKGDTSASFCLPDPFPDDTDGEQALYAVYARALGKPGGSAGITTCVEEGTELWCDTARTVELERNSKGGKSTAVDVSQELLTICFEGTGYGLFDDVDVDGDGTAEETEWFWEYDNDGLKLAQLRFYATDSGVTKQDACPK